MQRDAVVLHLDRLSKDKGNKVTGRRQMALRLNYLAAECDKVGKKACIVCDGRAEKKLMPIIWGKSDT